MENVILTVHLILALGLVVVVLLQRSEGGGLGMGGGGGGVMTGRQAATALGKLTWAFAIAFIATSITLTILAAREAATSSVIDTIGVEGGVEGGATPAAPALNDLLPPPVGGAPAPRAD
ncbi:MAG: preprotein translocase subunit SecG [Gemmobacter sp.]